MLYLYTVKQLNILVMETKVVLKSEVETTASFGIVITGDETLKPFQGTYNGKTAILLRIEYGEVNYERLSDWKRLLNKLDSYNLTTVKRLLVGDKGSMDWGGMVVTFDDGAEKPVKLKFTQPTDMVIETIGEDKYLIGKVSELQGDVSWEFYYDVNGRDNHPSGIGILMTQIEIMK